jgi:anti-sigma factor ChrR (cupin superfamily)
MPMTDLNADFSKAVVVRTAAVAWQASPAAGVWRKRLELLGAPESGRVTSIVRYEPGSRFPPHEHPDGEEILVLDGTFGDEHGSYPAGSYLLNPQGFSHAPRTDQGCVLFVKLRQYPGSEREHRVVDSNTADWQQSESEGRALLPLYEDAVHRERMRLVRLAPGTRVAEHDHPGGEEVYILAGTLADAQGSYEQGTWLRFPDGSRHQPFSEQGCTLYVKTGHLWDL